MNLVHSELAERVEEVEGHVRRRKDGTIKQRGGRALEAYKNLTDAELREKFVETAADIEMGYHETIPAGPFRMKDVMVALGYSANKAGYSAEDRKWLPSADVLRRMVALKVKLREVQRIPTDSPDSWRDAALGAGIEELLTRLYVNPLSFKNSELIDLVTKLARSPRVGPSGVVPAPSATSAVGYQRITETWMALPESERERLRPIYEKSIQQAREALPQ